MAVSTISAVFPCEVSKVWEIVTSLDNYQWRSDLSKIEKKDETTFVEYTKDGYATIFRITKTDPNKCWEFDMENDNMKGHWKGEFISKGDSTEIIFIEDVNAKKVFLKPFVRSFLKKQQQAYISDLTKEVTK